MEEGTIGKRRTKNEPGKRKAEKKNRKNKEGHPILGFIL